MQLKTTVKIVNDPKNEQAEVNARLAKLGLETPALGQHQDPSVPVSAPRQIPGQAVVSDGQPTYNQTVVTEGAMNPAIEASMGIPLAMQPVGCHVVIHRPTTLIEVAPGVQVHTRVEAPDPNPIPILERAPTQGLVAALAITKPRKSGKVVKKTAKSRSKKAK
jgi:hypothetical protein